MNCAWVEDRLLLYLASELEPRDAAALRSHLDDCTRCAAAAREVAETQEIVARVLQTTGAPREAWSAPSTLNARIMTAVRRESAASSSLARRASGVMRRTLGRATGGRVTQNGGRRLLAAAAAALCLLGGGYLVGYWHSERSVVPSPGLIRPARPTLALALLGDDHLEYLANPQPGQVPGPDPHKVARGLMPLLKFPVAAVDLEPDGARLLGGRKCVVHGVPVAFLIYDWNGERVSLYQIDGRKIALPPLRETTFHGRRFQLGEVNGLSYVAWRSGVMNFVMVSGAQPERLLRLACSASGMSQPA